LRTDNTQPILADQKPVVLSLAWDVLF
jgi:hypothetical protein